MEARAHLLLLHFSILTYLTHGSPIIESLSRRCYGITRDYNLALIHRFAKVEKIGPSQKCVLSRTQLYSIDAPIVAEALTYAIDKVNSQPDLLPNISLGFVAFDSCDAEPLSALGVTQYCLPDQNETNYFPNNELITCSSGFKRFRNIIGMIGPPYSCSAVVTVGPLSLFQIPSILTRATSDDLSDKVRFPYSLRLVSPNKFQAAALTDLLLHFGWTYAALVYLEGAYGENGAKQIQKNTKKKGICLAFTYMLTSDYTKDNIEEVVDQMQRYRRARIVITIVTGKGQGLLYSELLKRGETEHFILVGTDSFDTISNEYGIITDGSIGIKYIMSVSEELRSYYRSLTPRDSDSPWMRLLWSALHDCKWEVDEGGRSCYDFMNVTSIPEVSVHIYPEMIIDAVNTFAHAMQNLIEDNCPEALTDKTLLQGCLTGSQLHKYLLQTSANGLLGRIKFDENGDFEGSYALWQYHNSTGKSVLAAVWSRRTESLIVHSDKLKWFSHLKDPRIADTLPVSVCSLDCKPKEYYIQKELPCCWDCRNCRNNEILVGNKTGCEVCDQLTWPDEETATLCFPIEPTVLKWTDPLTLGLAGAISLGLCGCLVISVLFIKNRSVKIIKASSQQLMAVILFGIGSAYATALAFLVKPSDVSCYIVRFGFNLSVSLIYAPLVMKTNRIYRIFESGKRGTKRPSFVGARFQMVMVTCLMTIQVLLCVASVIISTPLPLSRMPVPTEKYVEVLCRLPLSALLPTLTFNLLIIITCAGFGFLTRKLPDNYNESWYIFVSVATTTFLWLVFLPAYFTAFYAVHQVMLLTSCLIINGTVTLVCLYVPKVYCIYFVDQSSIKVQMTDTTSTVNTTSTVVTDSSNATPTDN